MDTLTHILQEYFKHKYSCLGMKFTIYLQGIMFSIILLFLPFLCTSNIFLCLAMATLPNLQELLKEVSTSPSSSSLILSSSSTSLLCCISKLTAYLGFRLYIRKKLGGEFWGCLLWYVICIQCSRQMFIPVFLASIDHLLQSIYERLVEMLVKAIGLWVVSTGHTLLHIWQLE